MSSVNQCPKQYRRVRADKISNTLRSSSISQTSLSNSGHSSTATVVALTSSSISTASRVSRVMADNDTSSISSSSSTSATSKSTPAAASRTDRSLTRLKRTDSQTSTRAAVAPSTRVLSRRALRQPTSGLRATSPLRTSRTPRSQRRSSCKCPQLITTRRPPSSSCPLRLPSSRSCPPVVVIHSRCTQIQPPTSLLPKAPPSKATRPNGNRALPTTELSKP